MVSKYEPDLSGAIWVKSKQSSAQSNNCVEIARAGGIYAVRDSKRPNGARLIFDRDTWRMFIDAVKNDEFNSM